MNNQFDELAKALAQSVTRRAALKRFGVGLATFALAAIGVAPSAQAGKPIGGGLYAPCQTDSDCKNSLVCWYSKLFNRNVCQKLH